MQKDVGRDHLAIIRIDGMHSHKCEQMIQRALLSHKGVHEVEVDFASGQASVLFDKSAVAVKQLVTAIEGAGYRTAGVTQKKTAAPPSTHASQPHA